MMKSLRVKSDPGLRRYTSLASVLDLLQTGRITLLSPARWDDGNDSWFMSEYGRLTRAKTVLAVCFAQTSETYHHWRVFSPGPDGVCVEFNKSPLVESLEGQTGVIQGEVQYATIPALRRRAAVAASDLPFLKRKPYEPECEYRVVYFDLNKVMEAKDFQIDLGWIKRITLSPWMPDALKASVRKTLKSIPHCQDLSVVRSSLIGNDEWKKQAVRARA